MSENNMTTTSDVDPAVGIVYERTLLQPPQPIYIYTRYAEKHSIGEKSGTTIKFRRYARLSAATTPLTEGITPSGSKLSKVDLTAQVSQFGDFITITDVVDLTVEDQVLAVTVDRQNDQLNNTMDQLCRDYICASASSTACSHGSGTATLLNDTDIQGVVQTLRSNDCQYMFSRVQADTGVGTSPVRSAYVGMADADLENDLRAVDGFLDVVQYSRDQLIDEAEFGNTGNVRWLTSTGGYVSSSTYYCPIMGRDPSNLPYAMIDLSGGNATSIITAPNDPLRQRTTVGWKAWAAFRILQDLYIHVLTCTNG